MIPHAVRDRAPYSWRLGNLDLAVPGTLPLRLDVTERDNLGKNLFWTGLRDWEQETIPQFLEQARHSRRFLDVGSNNGIYSLLAARVNPSLSAIAYEPAPDIHAVLERNIALNGFASRIEARRQAVSDAPAIVQFHVSEDPTMSSLNPLGYRNRHGEVIDVQAICADSLLEEGFEPDLVKIDVESFEHLVLRGMQRILTTCRPVLLIECNTDGPYREVEAILSGAGYRFVHLTDNGAITRPHIVPDPREHFRNWLCLPLERSNMV